MSRSDCVAWTKAQWTAFWAVRWNDEFEATAASIARAKRVGPYNLIITPTRDVPYTIGTDPAIATCSKNAWFEGPKETAKPRWTFRRWFAWVWTFGESERRGNWEKR